MQQSQTKLAEAIDHYYILYLRKPCATTNMHETTISVLHEKSIKQVW